MPVVFEGCQIYEPKDDDFVHCKEHGITVRWGDLDAIKQLAVEEGIDTKETCILENKDD